MLYNVEFLPLLPFLNSVGDVPVLSLSNNNGSIRAMLVCWLQMEHCVS